MTRVFSNVEEFDLTEIQSDVQTDFLLVEPSPIAFRWIPKGSGRTVVWLVAHLQDSNLPAALASDRIDANVLLCDVATPLGGLLSRQSHHSELLDACFRIIFRICGAQRCIIVAEGGTASNATALGSALPQATTVLFTPNLSSVSDRAEFTGSQRRDIDTAPRILSIWDANPDRASLSERFVESLPLNVDVHTAVLDCNEKITLATQVEFVRLAIEFPEWKQVCSEIDHYSQSLGPTLGPKDKEFPIQTVELDLLNRNFAFEVTMVSHVDLAAKDLAVVVDFSGWHNPPLHEFTPFLQWSPGLSRHFYYLDATPANKQQEILSFSGEASCGRIAVSVLRWDIDASKSCNLDLEFKLTTAN